MAEKTSVDVGDIGFTESQVSEALHLSKAKLRKDRRLGTGIDYLKIGMKQVINGLYEKVGVFKIGQKSDIGNYTQGYEQFFPTIGLSTINQMSEGIIHNGGKYQQRKKVTSRLIIEKQTC